MRRAIALAWLAALTAGCSLFPPTLPDSVHTTSAAGGTVQLFNFNPKAPGRMDLGRSRRLLLSVSAPEVSSPAFQFRVQGMPPHPSQPLSDVLSFAELAHRARRHPPTGGEGETGTLTPLGGRGEGEGGHTHGHFRESTTELLAAGPLTKRRVANFGLTDSPGAENKFWVNTGDSTLAGDRERTAVNEWMTPHAYFYIDKEARGFGTQELKQQIQDLGEAFETIIHPTVSRVFGSEPTPGIDGDPRVYVVISPAVDNFGSDKGLMGYFWSRDALPKAGIGPRSHSNEKEVIFLTDQIFNQRPWTTYGTLAHEFTHLVVFNQKTLLPGRTVSEETWLDEAMAMLAMDLCGYGLRAGNEEIAKDIKSFQDQPQLYSLTDWFRNPRGFSYGQSYLFARYLHDRFGEGFIKDVMAQPAVGVESVHGVVGRRGLSFRDVFTDWTIANAISGSTLTRDPRFNYHPQINLRSRYGAVQLTGVRALPLAAPQNIPGTLRPWGTAYYLMQGEAERQWNLELNAQHELFGGGIRLP